MASQEAPESVSINEIGWLFVKNYYHTYTADIEKLYVYYDKDASLLHDEFPQNSDQADGTKKVHLADGTDAIKAHFVQSESSDKNKIVIERADFQHSVGGSILIVVCGSWKRGSSALWQFVQTFVLKPVDTKLYDVANDMLKFIDFSDEYREPEVLVQKPLANGEAKETEAEAEVSEEPEKEEKEEKAEKEEKEEKEEKAEKEEKEEKAEAEKEEVKQEEEQEEEEKGDSTPSAKPTWANLAAIEPKVPSSKTATVASPVAAKSARAPSPTVRKSSQSSQSTTPVQQQAQPVQKFKKEEWYPIYIRNVDVEEDELKGALVERFGDIKFFRKTARAALCDFRHKEDQQKALEAKEIVVRNNVISLEPRLHKVFNGKPDSKHKEKKVPKKAVNGKKN